MTADNTQPIKSPLSSPSSQKKAHYVYGAIHYRDVRSVNTRLMQRMSVSVNAQKDLFRSLQFCPLVASEAPKAANVYPIVFSPVGKPVPIALFRLNDGENPFALGNGRQSKMYVPAAVRRYPYMASEIRGSQNLVLSVDASQLMPFSQSSNTSELEPPLFSNGGQATDHFYQVAEFCRVFEEHNQATYKVLTLLEKMHLLESATIEVFRRGVKVGESGQVKVIQSKRFSELSKTERALLKRYEVLPLIAAHFSSLLNLKHLGGRLKKQYNGSATRFNSIENRSA